MDRPAVANLVRALRDLDVDLFFDETNLLAGRHWQGDLIDALNQYDSVALIYGPSGLGNWQKLEQGIALNRQARDPSFHVIPVILPGADLTKTPLGFLELNTWVDLRSDWQNGVRALAAAAAGTLPDDLANASDRLRQEVNPYRGLGQFREEDAAFYFGRHEASVALSEAVKENRFVAVVGGTGGGKSSLVRAGLLP
ncbi:MAG: toll/interleukin-1 receptor domain-containing protein, partial [Pseudomonadota bacterium]